MTKKRYIKNTLEFSLERGIKNRGGKTNLFISSKAKLNHHKARIHDNTLNDGSLGPGYRLCNSPLIPSNTLDDGLKTHATTERQAIPATESTITKGEITGPSGSNDIKGVVK